jgi:hypothetical protein
LAWVLGLEVCEVLAWVLGLEVCEVLSLGSWLEVFNAWMKDLVKSKDIVLDFFSECL